MVEAADLIENHSRVVINNTLISISPEDSGFLGIEFFFFLCVFFIKCSFYTWVVKKVMIIKRGNIKASEHDLIIQRKRLCLSSSLA